MLLLESSKCIAGGCPRRNCATHEGWRYIAVVAPGAVALTM